MRLATAIRVGPRRAGVGAPDQIQKILKGACRDSRVSDEPRGRDLRERARPFPYRGFFRARMIAALSSPPYTKIVAIEYRKTSATITEPRPA